MIINILMNCKKKKLLKKIQTAQKNVRKKIKNTVPTFLADPKGLYLLETGRSWVSNRNLRIVDFLKGSRLGKLFFFFALWSNAVCALCTHLLPIRHLKITFTDFMGISFQTWK